MSDQARTLLVRSFLSSLYAEIRYKETPGPNRGLPNIGNTCFLNATLAALYYTVEREEMARALDKGGRLSYLISHFLAVFQVAHAGIRELLRAILTSIPTFADGKHHCAASFLLHLLQFLDKECQETFPLPSSPISTYLKGCRNLALHDMFAILHVNAFTCTQCGHITEGRSYSRVLALPIPTLCDESSQFFDETDFFSLEIYQLYEKENDAYSNAIMDLPYLERPPIRVNRKTTLSSCFKYHFRAHLMQGENQLTCDNCGLTDHYKQSFMRHTGSLLVIQLQRYNQLTGNKLETPVSAHEEELDLRPFGANLGVYQLAAVICHFGTLRCGHYVANVKAGDCWWEVNDAYVSRISRNELYDNAILLYYRKTA